MIEVLRLGRAAMTEPVVATLDPARKLEILKEYSRHIKQKEWAKGIRAHVEIVEQVLKARNIAGHQPATPGPNGELYFRGSAASKVLKNLTGDQLPVAGLAKSIALAERALANGQNLIENFQRFGAEYERRRRS